MGSALLAQRTNIDLGIRKSLRDQLDDIVFDFQSYGRLNDDVSRIQFKRLFTDTAEVFDFITPNYVTEKRKTGQEIVKSVDAFIEDVQAEFPQGFMQVSVKDASLGSAIDYNTFNISQRQIDLEIEFDIVGISADGGQYSNDPKLKFLIVFDTLNNLAGNIQIAGIEKIESRLRFQQEERQPLFEKQIGFNGGYSIVSSNTDDLFFGEDYSMDKISIDSDISYSAGIDLIRLVAAPEPNEFSWSFGLYFSEIGFQLSMDSYYYSDVRIDKDNDLYFNNVIGENFRENVKMRFLEIPLRFRYERAFSRIFSFYIQPGVDLGYNYQTIFSGSGTFTYTGFYPELNLLIRDVEEYNFVSDYQQTFNDQMIQTSNYAVSGALNVGFNMKVFDGWLVYLGAAASKSVINLSIKETNHLISTEMGQNAGVTPSMSFIDFGKYGIQVAIRKKFETKNGLLKLE
ncbi:MAG: hypothetical protein JXQ90_02670 [Cyclobacteriaceae bacterium]